MIVTMYVEDQIVSINVVYVEEKVLIMTMENVIVTVVNQIVIKFVEVLQNLMIVMYVME